MSELQNMKYKANEQVQELIKRNIFKKEWDIKIITISNHDFLYIDCDSSKIDIKFVKDLCRQHMSKDLIYKLAVLIN